MGAYDDMLARFEREKRDRQSRAVSGDPFEDSESVRCPECGHFFDFGPEDEEDFRLDDYETEVYCPACHEEFEVGVEVCLSFTLTSPAIDKKEQS